MQRGSVYRERNHWYVRYRETQIQDGKPVRIRVARKLAPVGAEYPTPRSVWPLAEKIISPVNDKTMQPASSQSVSDFIKDFYLPHVKTELRPSTYKDYNDIYRVHLKDRLDIRLRDFRTVHGQRLMREITGIGHTSLLRVKSFLSGAFKHAKREGILDGENPMRDVSVPGRPTKFKGPVYDLDEILKILYAVPDPAKIVVAVAAVTGLRLAELRGLRWGDFGGDTLTVSRSVWRTHVSAPKTSESEATIPVLPMLRDALEKHRKKVAKKNPEAVKRDAYIFAGERRGASLNLANLARRVIVPALNEKKIEWKGWHSFRRSLASTLYSMGVQPKVIQAILRHSDIGTTLKYYVRTPDAETRAAMEKIEEQFDMVGLG
jgi:integrase